MIVVQNSIVSDDIADRRFGCDLGCCRGACCVDGDSGAPLLKEEVPVLEAILPEVKPYMTAEGLDAVERQGVAVRDNDGDLGTPLIAGGACAYITYDGDLALCAIEKAFRANNFQFPNFNFQFPKPVSCHLYPIRVEDYGEFTAVNYHRWDICRSAQGHGDPLYIYLKEPLVRRFGQAWYDELLGQIKLSNND